MFCLVSCYDPRMVMYLLGLESTPSFHGQPSMTLVFQDQIATADMFYRLMGMMQFLQVPMWVETNMIQFELYSPDTILTLMTFLNGTYRTVSQKFFIDNNILYSTVYYEIPIQI